MSRAAGRAGRRPLTVDAEPAFRTREANPYNALLYEHLGARGVVVRELSVVRLATSPPDVVHLHWPELTFLSGRRWWRTAFRVSTFAAALAVARARRGTRLVWTVHNLTAHEADLRGRQARAFWWWFPRQVDGLLALTSSGAAQVRVAHPSLAGRPTAVTPHGDYRDQVADAPDRGRARRELGLESQGPVVLFVGQVRPYKDVPALLRAFADVPDPAARLVVAGRASPPELSAELTALAADDPRVVLDLAFQSPERLAAWLAAADLVALPYGAVLNSGSALLALSADRPVLVPGVGAMPELAEAVGPEWVRTYSGPFTGQVLRDGLAWAASTARPARSDLAGFGWDRVAELTEAALRDLVGSARRVSS